MGFFNCRVCLKNDQYGNCDTDATICVTMRKFNPRCKGYQPLCNSLAGGYVAASTVCQQALFTGSESSTAARYITTNTTTGAQTIVNVPVGDLSPYNGTPIIASCSSLANLGPTLSPLNQAQ